MLSTPPIAPDTVNTLDVERATQLRDEALNSLPPNLQLDATQIAAHEAIVPITSRGLFILRGSPGSGKSVISRLIVYNRAVQDGVIMLAPTNYIKRRMSSHAETVHAMSAIPFGRTFSGLKPDHKHLRMLTTCHTIIIDGAFMVTNQNLQFLRTRLSEAQDISLDAVLQKNTIVPVGDEKQLPPICNFMCLYREDICTTHHIAVNANFSQAWHDPARNFLLAVNHRNPAMAHKLAHIANQHNVPSTQQWVDENINIPFCRVAPLDLHSRMLTSHHADALDHDTSAVTAFAQNKNADLVLTTREFYRQAPQLGDGKNPHFVRRP